MRPTFSIIIVSLNAGEELHKTIASVMEQSYEDFEIILKDGGSTDGSIEALVDEPRLRRIVCKDKGIYDAMNQACPYVRGRYVLFLNCGDYLYNKDVLKEVHAKIKEDAASPSIYYGDNFERKTGNRVSANPNLNEFALFRNIPCHQACFYEAHLLERNPVYLTEFKVRADYEHFLWCCYEKKANPQYLGCVIASYEGGGFSETKENEKKAKAEHKIITEKYMDKKNLIKYRSIMAVTLQPLRKKLSESKSFSAAYQKMKTKLYH